MHITNVTSGVIIVSSASIDCITYGLFNDLYVTSDPDGIVTKYFIVEVDAGIKSMS